jgi:hypothetical protein
MSGLKESVAVAVCRKYRETEQVVKELRQHDFDLKKLSVIGKDNSKEDKVNGFYALENTIGVWGKKEAFQEEIWGEIGGIGFFFIPRIGHLVLAGPILSSLITSFEKMPLSENSTPLGLALYNTGIPRDCVEKYETELKSDRYLVIAPGVCKVADRLREIMAEKNHVEAAVHH